MPITSSNALKSIFSGRRLYALIIACVYFLTVLRIGSNNDPVGIDSSWSLVLAWAYHHGMQWGQDIRFTYGPLGFMYPLAAYYPDGYNIFYIAQLATTAVQACIVTLIALRLPAVLSAAFLALLIFWSYFLWADSGVFVYVAMIVVLTSNALIDSRRTLRTWMILPLFLLGAVFAWIKFSWLVLWACGVVTIAVRVGISATWRRAGVVIAGAAAILLIVWFGAGQSVTSLFHYLSQGGDVSSGYLAAMSTQPGIYVEILGICAVLAYLFALAFAWHRDRRNASLAALLLFLACTLFLLWHAAYTRADGHVNMLFPSAALLLLVLHADNALVPQRSVQGVSILCSIAITVAGALIVGSSPLTAIRNAASVASVNADIIAHPTERRRLLDQIWNMYASQHELPRTKTRVGDRSIDLLMTAQGLVLLNHLHYAPRPVFQSYAAYTPDLDRANEAYFLGDRAPDFVLLRMDAIDQRFPAEEDSLSLIALLRRYKPALGEAGYLLLERTDARPEPVVDPQTLKPIDVHLGDYFNIPQADGTPVVLFADVQLSLLGKLYTFFLREPRLTLDIDAAGNHPSEFRFLRGVGRAGFLASPALFGDNDYLKITLNDTPIRPRRMRVRCSEGWQRLLFASGMQLRFAVLPPFPVHSTADDSSQFIYPNINPPPNATHGMIKTIVEGKSEAIFMHAPATLEFALAPGKYGLKGEFGITAAAYTQANCPPESDGIDLVIQVAGTGKPRIVAKSHINPFANPRDRGDQHIALDPIIVAADQHLELSVMPAANAACDWGYVRDIRISTSSR